MGVMHIRRETTQVWADQNPVLSKDLVALDTDTDEFRIGDGETRWSKLPVYSRKGSGSSATSGDAIVVIPHGDDPNYPRPDGVLVGYWLGTVEPMNAVNDDLWSAEVDVP